jgi:hypothetical protein
MRIVLIKFVPCSIEEAKASLVVDGKNYYFKDELEAEIGG